MTHWYYVVALLISTASAIIVSIVAWGRWSAPAARPLANLGIAIAAWTLTYAAYFVSPTGESRLFWLKATYVGVLAIPALFFLFSVQYANRWQWLKKRILAVLIIEPSLTFILLWTDPWHHLFFGGLPVSGVILHGGIWFWINVVYSYALILISMILLVHAFRHMAHPLRRQAAIILLGASLPLLINILAVTGLNPIPGMDPTPFAFTITGICLTIGYSRYGLLDMVPIARDVLIENMGDAVWVLDAQNRVVDINRTSLQLIGKSRDLVIGEPAEVVFASLNEIFKRFRDTLTTRQEIVIGDNPPYFYDLRITPLYNRKGRFSGRLIVARDITERHMIEKAEHEQRVLAEALRETSAALNSVRTFEGVLDRLFDNVGNVVPFDLARFLLIENQKSVRAARSRGYQENGLEEKLEYFSVSDIPNFQAMIDTGKALVVPDPRESKYWGLSTGMDKIRSYTGAPLLVKGEVIGFLELNSFIPNFYTEEHAARLQAFADQVAMAIENARLFDETRKRAEQMAVLFDIGLTLTSGLDMDHTLKTLLEKCRQVLPIEAFYVAVFEPETGLIHHPLAYDMGEYPSIPTRNLQKTPGLSGHIITTRQTLYIPDMLSPDAIKTYQIFRTSGKPTRSFVGVPMIVGDLVAGVISMQSYSPNAYTPEQIRLLETIATQAAESIENSRLYRKAQQEIGERKKAEQRYRALFEQSHDAVFIIDFKGKHLEANQRASELLGYSPQELIGMSVSDVSAQKDASENVMSRLAKGEHIPLYERAFLKKNGEKVVAEINVELVRDENGVPIHIQSVVRDISQRKRDEETLKKANRKLQRQIAEIESLQEQLREQAIRDSLTGLFNRRYLEEILPREFQLAKRKKTTVCLLMIDIDGFKAFNDTYGHDAGDLLLSRLGEFLRSEIRSSDISCRFGGEEFLVVMPGTQLDKAFERAEHLRTGFLSLTIMHMGKKLNATLSIGLALYPQHGDTWEEVLHMADRALYLAKDAGKNCTRTI